MTTNYIILTVFEFLLFISVVLSIIFEYKLINFENRIKEKIKNFLRRAAR